jgi:hypothetical protein
MLDQTLDANGGANDVIKFEQINAFTAPDFDFSAASTTGQVIVLTAGTYSIQTHCDGRLAAPFPAPVPSWGIGLYKNGVIVNGSQVAGFSQSPDDDALSLTAQVVIDVAANDTFMVKNIAKGGVFLKANHPELVVLDVSASLIFVKIS